MTTHCTVTYLHLHLIENRNVCVWQNGSNVEVNITQRPHIASLFFSLLTVHPIVSSLVMPDDGAMVCMFR